jgi:hypothetical protein
MSKEPVKRNEDHASARQRAQTLTVEEREEIDRRQRTEPDYLEKTKPEDPSARPGQLTRDNVNPNIPSGPKERPLLPDGRVDPNAGGIVDPKSLGMESQGGAAPPPVTEPQEVAAGREGEPLPAGTPLPRAGSINEPPGSNVLGKTEEDIPPEIVAKGKPVLTGLEPDEAVSGDPDLMLVISGDNFFSGSVIVFGEHDEPTTFDEAAGTVSTGVKPSLFQPAVVPVKVRNGALVSDPMEFEFTAPAGDDPDELEDEIDQMKEDGDISSRKPKRKR